jgi:hypothetical protein
MVSSYVQAVRKGTAAAARLHQQLNLRATLEVEGGAVNVFGLISQLDVPLMLRPLDGLLGAYLSVPVRIPRKMGIDSTRSWALVPRHLGQSFHAKMGS